MRRALIRSMMCWLILAGSAAAETVTVFAAASLRNALDAVSEAFAVASGHTVSASYAGSSVLARQIGFGAPADVFISANPDWMDWLQSQGAIVEDSRIDLLGNRLVLVTASKATDPVEISKITDLLALLDGGTMAMGLVNAVPAGIYGRLALEKLGHWSTLAPHVVQTDNVRAALALAALGEARLAVVYQSDAMVEPRVWAVGHFPETSHPPIIYPAARITDTETAQAFMSFLQTDKAARIFADHGFLPPDAQ